MRGIKKITSDSRQVGDLTKKGRDVTVLDQEGRFSSESRIDKESIELVDLRRGGISKPFLKKVPY